MSRVHNLCCAVARGIRRAHAVLLQNWNHDSHEMIRKEPEVIVTATAVNHEEHEGHEEERNIFTTKYTKLHEREPEVIVTATAVNREEHEERRRV